MEKIINIFGSSIVWGGGDSEMGGWANRLRHYLENETQDYSETYNLGVAGDTSEGLLKRFIVENEARKPDVIIIAIGLNDSAYINSKDNPRVSLEKFEKNLLELAGQAKKFTKEIVFVGLTKIDETKLKPVPWNDTIYYDEKNVMIYDTKLKEFCKNNKLMFVEMQDVLSKDDLVDGLHPNANGHEKMFLRVKDFLIENKII